MSKLITIDSKYSGKCKVCFKKHTKGTAIYTTDGVDRWCPDPACITKEAQGQAPEPTQPEPKPQAQPPTTDTIPKATDSAMDLSYLEKTHDALWTLAKRKALETYPMEDGQTQRITTAVIFKGFLSLYLKRYVD